MKTYGDLEKAFKECKEMLMPICVALKLPNQESEELIINAYSALESKLKYYKENYDEQLRNKKNPEVRILDAFPINFYYDEFEKAIAEDITKEEK